MAAQPAEVYTPGVVVKRAPLPPVELEIVAGNGRHTAHADRRAIAVNIGNSATSKASAAEEQEPASVSPASTNAAERVKLSADANDMSQPAVAVRYPVLAQQMKVQGTVTLQAMISPDGAIQEVRTVTGPTILASAAEEAVREWRFKRYLESGVPGRDRGKDYRQLRYLEALRLRSVYPSVTRLSNCFRN